MATPHSLPRLDHPIVVTFLIFAVIGFLSLAAEVLKPLALAILLSFALAPVAGFFERRGLPRFLSVLVTVLLALGLLGGIGYQVGREFTGLAQNVERYKNNVEAKLGRLSRSGSSTINKLDKVREEVSEQLGQPPMLDPKKVQPVQVIAEPNYRQRLESALGPYLEAVGVGVFVLILVLFILVQREDLNDRVVRLVGQRRVSVTTRTLEEVGQRISRYLGMLTLVNASVGLIVGVGLWLIGVHYALLWGVLAALLRFIPYAGPATAFALPFVFSIADSNEASWRVPLMVLGLFAGLEVVANSFLEPVIYGRTTGVSALGLLVAAMFWTWLWGLLGLLLSTPMTVCLAVLGKSVPSLGFFATLLGEEPPLQPDVRFYQRLLAMDQDGANEILDAELQRKPRVQVFDEVLIPTLVRSERDRLHDELDERELAFIGRVIGDALDDLAESPEIDLKTLASDSSAAAAERNGSAPAAPEPLQVLGVAANDQADALALRMLEILLTPLGHQLTIITNPDTPLRLAEEVAERNPQVVVLSHVPPGGFTLTRYLVRRLRARFPDLPLVVGRWNEPGDPREIADRLTKLGASGVVFRLEEAREALASRARSADESSPDGTRPAELTTSR